MRVLICGSRDWHKAVPIDVFVGGLARVYGRGRVTIIEGQQRGADLLAASAAQRHGVGHEPYPADWPENHAPPWAFAKAGHERNQRMLDAKPDLVVAFKNGFGEKCNAKGEPIGGTEDMVKRAKAAGIPAYVMSEA